MPDKPNRQLRIARFNSLIQKLLGEILSEHLEENNALVTVSRVETSGDMRWAKVWLSILGGDEDKILTHLKSQLYDIQGELNRQIAIKLVPRIQFFVDSSPEYAQHIAELIDSLHNEGNEPSREQPETK